MSTQLKVFSPMKFTFHYGSILIASDEPDEPDASEFTFHYGSILMQMQSQKYMKRGKNLHSTMVLF